MKSLGKVMAGVIIGILCTISIPALAATVSKNIEVYTGVSIYVDDVKLNAKDANGNPVEAFIYNGTTYLPVRAISEAVGKPVVWDGKTTTVYLGKHDSTEPTAYLHNMDYYSGVPYKYAVTEKDNLGKTRENCLYVLASPTAGTIYKLNGQYSKMTGTFFQLYDYRSSESKTSISIYGDGKLLYTKEISGGVDPVDFAIDLKGVLELKITSEGSSIYRRAALSNCGFYS